MYDRVMASFSIPAETFVLEWLKMLSDFNSKLGPKYFIIWNDSDQFIWYFHFVFIRAIQLWTYSSCKRVRLVYAMIRNLTDEWNTHYYMLKNVSHTYWNIYCCTFCLKPPVERFKPKKTWALFRRLMRQHDM